MKGIITTLFALLAVTSLTAQKNVFITISPKNAGVDLQMATDITALNGVKYNLDHFDYYLSGLHIIHDGGQDLDLSDTVFLVEPANFVLYLGYLNVTTIEQVNFSVGVPSNINTSSGADAIDIAAYPAGHPLSFQDPSMHWGWTAGYMHMIIGGEADSNDDGIIDYGFELHNLGDANYRSVQLPVVQTNTSVDQIDIYMNCNVDYWIKDIAIESVGILHGTSGANMEILKNVETEPVFDQSATASVPSIYESIGKVYFSTNISSVIVSWEFVKDASSYTLTDISGKLIQKGKVDNMNGSVIFENLTNGIYHFHLLDQYSNKLNDVKIAK
jgi:hypothetical protein